MIVLVNGPLVFLQPALAVDLNEDLLLDALHHLHLLLLQKRLVSRATHLLQVSRLCQ